MCRLKKMCEGDAGQVMMVFALLTTVALLGVGIGVDVGLCYNVKAKLTTAVDAACLAAMKNLWQGQSTASTIGADVFTSNYGPSAPVPSITFPTDAQGNQQVSVTATVDVQTAFMQLIPRWRTVPVRASATATKGKLVMSTVVDRSGSMCGGTNHCDNGVTGNKGGVALQAAIPAFVGDFNDSTDQVGLVSFASNANNEVALNYNFKSAIQTAISRMAFSGGTFGTGAGTQTILSTTQGPPLSLAKLQVDSVTVHTGDNVIKVVVYVTDGLMNTIQDSFNCPSATLLNYGGHDSGSQVDIFDPNTGTDWGHYTSGTGFPRNSSGAICKTSSGQIVSTFYSQQSGTQKSFTQSNVTAEAKYRAIQTATALRTETTPTFIFTIGVGSGVTSSTQAFLAQLANDPSYPSTYISGQPAGLFFYIASCPSTTCTAEIQRAFQTIAGKVMLRLTS